MAFVLNVLARILGSLLRIDHSLSKPPKTIAVCKFVGMGSIVQSIPLLKTLRKNFPHSKIIFITTDANKKLFEFIPEVDRVFTISDANFGTLIFTNLKLLLKLWSNKPDVYIDLEIYSHYSSITATLSLSRNRMGFYKNDKQYRMGMYTHMMYFNIKSPISNTYLQFAGLLACDELILDLGLNRKHNCFEDHDRLLNRFFIDKPYFIINPNASELRLERRWESEKMSSLIQYLTEVYSEYNIVLIGSADETEYVHSIYSMVDSKSAVVDTSGKLSIPELISMISAAALMITNDTGPMHLAFSLKVPTVSLFGPCSPGQYGGTEKNISIYKNVYCSPCVHEFIVPPCKGDNQCMKKIELEDLKLAVEKAMKNDFVSEEILKIDYRSEDKVVLGKILRS